MRDLINKILPLFEAQQRDEMFDRFWWRDGDFDWLDDDTTHADHVANQIEDMATGDYDDEINNIGDTAEDINHYYKDNRSAVRGGVLKPKHDFVFIDAARKADARRCLRDLLREFPSISEATIEAGSTTVTLKDASLDAFVRRGVLPILREAAVREQYFPWSMPQEFRDKNCRKKVEHI